MMWIIISILLGITTLLLLISNSLKNEQITALKYTIVYMASNDDVDVDKAMQEWERFKGWLEAINMDAVNKLRGIKKELGMGIINFSQLKRREHLERLNNINLDI